MTFAGKNVAEELQVLQGNTVALVLLVFAIGTCFPLLTGFQVIAVVK